MSQRVAEKWKDAVELHGIYGPAEASCCAWNPTLGKERKSTNLGRPISSVFWVVDPTDSTQLVPIGCIGELLVQGPMLARGYLRADEAATTNWIEDDNRLPDTTLGRAYLTGDLVKCLHDGTYEYVGRKDTQVKLNGQRVELGEIEHYLDHYIPKDMSGVVDIVANTKTGSKGLIAILWETNDADDNQPGFRVVPDITKDMQEGLAHVESSLRAVLPAFMVPSSFLVFCGDPPRTVSGKIDRRQLREIVRNVSPTNRMRVSWESRGEGLPSTHMALQLREVWAAVLEISVEEIGDDDSFLQIGGDSITAIQLVGAAREAGISLTVAQIIAEPHLRKMAATATEILDEGQTVFQVDAFSLLPAADRERTLIQV